MSQTEPEWPPHKVTQAETRGHGAPDDEEVLMNWDQIKGNWNQLKGKAQKEWGKLTDDDMKIIEGEQTQLVGRIQERYGYTREQAEKAVAEWHERSR